MQELMDSRDKSLYSQQKLDDSSSVMFTLPFTLPAEKKPFECSKYEEVVVGLTSQVNTIYNSDWIFSFEKHFLEGGG